MIIYITRYFCAFHTKDAPLGYFDAQRSDIYTSWRRISSCHAFIKLAKYYACPIKGTFDLLQKGNINNI